ncbi:E3 ubiquitin-protein ligase RNF4-like [Vespula squamosa]|uniref:E3 ubiquitin-protein ligase RNF4-like n=1 Tax=Vespula squamosa TaxID=30214 RepID=A0ABD2A8T7_VESSQ
MASTQKNKMSSRSISSTIDIIDLTDESYLNRSSQPYNNASEDFSNSYGSMTRAQYNLSLQQEQTATLVSTVLDTIGTAIAITTSRNTNKRRNRNNGRRTRIRISSRSRTRTIDRSIIEESNEIIDVDDTASPQCSGPWCINDSSTVAPTALICAICLEELQSKRKPTTTSCGHIFCEECLRKVIREKKKCPTCQSKITQKSCTRLYF